ncbi:tRNA lysidine(34) synthetase TilS [Actibacterium sp. XHP0104]|uniref:tRNA lysidine(34) synthetase TilS n=1 Tax=Actibacterium sp. XHP0104 TaxID=2984335 RepID=UPI0021E8A9F8|nr:tRNA lysidine(34) synthetase TilS [Actibacterium sp. XHP0104]MCV2880500.1 tRNA lysidine(34) synthetase TilS [Actibacterium sp. XHP0104]
MQLTPAPGDPAACFAAFFNDDMPARLGVAVSGGGDSVALLHLAHRWAAGRDVALETVTVNHGLRPEAAEEAAFVARLCADLGIPHQTLRWGGWDGQGNLMDRARDARQELIADWAAARGVGHVALGHTLDDQAETVLMRLARGSGVDGLSGMAARSVARGLVWLRPLLDVRREALRDVLRGAGQDWIEDPSNDDMRFQRVKARQALAQLADLGIDPAGLADTADRMTMAREVLEGAALSAARTMARVEAGDVVFDAAALADLPDETRLRLMAGAVCWVGSSPYRPRLSALRDALSEALAGRSRTLQGALLFPHRGTLRVTRELNAVSGQRCAPADRWDGRWRVTGPDLPGAELRALGEAGLAQCGPWRDTGLPRVTLLASVSIWQGEALIAAPLAGFGAKWRAELAQSGESWPETLISH